MRLHAIPRTVALLLAAQVCCLPTGASPPGTPDLQAKLRAPVRNYSLSANSFVEALTRVASDFHISMGIEWVDAPQARSKLALSWKRATVRKVLETIAKGQPGYEMRVGNGTVHVFSPRAVPDRQNFLKLRIKKFEAHDELGDQAAGRLRVLVMAKVARPEAPSRGGARRGGIASSGASNVEYPKVSIRLRNASVEEILDALAVASPRKIWIVTFSDDPALIPGGFRRTLSLWSALPIPNSDQPVWDMFHWGDAIPTALLKK